ncbi:hypothetical protein D3C77_593230 [compost metagenome]
MSAKKSGEMTASTIFSATVSTAPRAMSGSCRCAVSRPTIMPSARRAAGRSPRRKWPHTSMPASRSPLAAMVVAMSAASTSAASHGLTWASKYSAAQVTAKLPPATSSGSSSPAIR